MRSAILTLSGISALMVATPALARIPQAEIDRVAVAQQTARNVSVRGRLLDIQPLRRTTTRRRGIEQLDLQIVEADRARGPVHHFRFLIRDGTLVGYGRGLNRPPVVAASIRPIRLTGQTPEILADTIQTIEPRPVSELGGGNGTIVAIVAAAAIILGIQ